MLKKVIVYYDDSTNVLEVASDGNWHDMKLLNRFDGGVADKIYKLLVEKQYEEEGEEQ